VAAELEVGLVHLLPERELDERFVVRFDPDEAFVVRFLAVPDFARVEPRFDPRLVCRLVPEVPLPPAAGTCWAAFCAWP
jgi:hypothetical protein